MYKPATRVQDSIFLVASIRNLIPVSVRSVLLAPLLKPDLILLDFGIPRMTGAERAVILKRLMPHVPIIRFTMHDDSVNKALAAAMRVDRVIAKADGMTKLLECMCDVLGLPPSHMDTVGPLQLPIDSTPETQPASTPEEKLPK